MIERAGYDGREWEEEIRPNFFVSMSSARFSDADIEGTALEMRAIAHAIRSRTVNEGKCVAVDASGESVFFWSPRNSERKGEVFYEEALDLAQQIENMCGLPK